MWWTGQHSQLAVISCGIVQSICHTQLHSIGIWCFPKISEIVNRLSFLEEVEAFALLWWRHLQICTWNRCRIWSTSRLYKDNTKGVGTQSCRSQFWELSWRTCRPFLLIAFCCLGSQQSRGCCVAESGSGCWVPGLGIWRCVWLELKTPIYWLYLTWVLSRFSRNEWREGQGNNACHGPVAASSEMKWD